MSIPESWKNIGNVPKLQHLLDVDKKVWATALEQSRTVYIEKTLLVKGKKRDLCYPTPDSELYKVQKLIKNRILLRVDTHTAICGYLQGNHNINVAAKVAGFPIIGMVDIRKFHPSITQAAVASALHKHGISPRWSRIIAKLCTFQGRLPQGASTSNHLANLILDVIFRRHLVAYCSKRQIVLVNYGDDIAVCGQSRVVVGQCVRFIKKQIQNYGYKPSEEKCNEGQHQGESRQFIGCSTARSQPDYPRSKYRALRKELRHRLFLVEHGDTSLTDKELISLKFRISYVNRLNRKKARSLLNVFDSLCAKYRAMTLTLPF